MFHSNVFQQQFGNFANTSVSVSPTPFMKGDLDPDGSVEEWLKAANMNFRYERADIQYLAPGEAVHRTYPKAKVIYRDDNRQAIAHVSDRFVPTQPEQVVELYQRICKSHDFRMDKLGCLKGGKAIWALAETTLHGRTMGQDEQRGYVLLHTPNDGTGSFMIKLINKSLACDNMLNAALAGYHDFDKLDYLYKIPHSSEPNFDRIGAELEKLPKYYNNFLDHIDELANTPIDTEQTVRFFLSLYGDKYDDASPAAEKHMHRLMQVNLDGPGQKLRARRGTVYGALSAVTHYYDHVINSRGSHLATKDENRTTSAYFGTGESIKNKAFKKALALVA
ncbi:MAG: hypothetical protein C9356_15160 [Oleiphilus sp.]|nr:MAG: hypothetical protein C9356_15160 [Oleiphilus sp.]